MPAPSQLPRFKSKQTVHRHVATTQEDSLEAIFIQARDVSMLASTGPGPSWLADDTFLGDVTTRAPTMRSKESTEGPGSEAVESDEDLEDVTPRQLEGVESEDSEDEVLTSYRGEPAVDVPTVIEELSTRQALRRSTSRHLTASTTQPCVTSTPRPGYIAPPAPSPFLIHRDKRDEEDLPISAAEYRSAQLSASASSAANQTSISSHSANLSASYVAPPDPSDDMFERKKRDSARHHGIVFEADVDDSPMLPSPADVFLSLEARPMVLLPGRARSTDMLGSLAMPPPPPPVRTIEPTPSLSSSVLGLTMPREFNFAAKPAGDGMTARERSAARAAEVARQAPRSAISAAFVAPKAKSRPRPSSAAPLRASTKRQQVEEAPRVPLTDRSNKNSAPRPTVSLQSSRANSLVQSQPAPRTTSVVPFTFRSSVRSERPTPSLSASAFASVRSHADEDKKRKRAMEKARTATTEARPFSFASDKRLRREAS